MPQTLQELCAQGDFVSSPQTAYWLTLTSQNREDYSTDLSFVSYLESLPPSDQKTYSNVLSCLPPELVVQEYGLDSLVWTHIQGEGQDEGLTALREEALQAYGIATQHLNLATIWANLQHRHGDYSLAITQFQVMNALAEGVVESIDLPGRIKAAALPEVTISEKRAADYSLRVIEPREAKATGGGWESKDWYMQEYKDAYYHVWLDAPASIGLWYKDRPAALVSLGATGEDILMVKQIQTINAKKYSANGKKVIPSRGLMPINWQQVLVGSVEEVASSLGFAWVGIQSGENNPWTVTKNMNLSKKAAYARYDVQAKRLGYTRNQDDRNWYKHVA